MLSNFSSASFAWSILCSGFVVASGAPLSSVHVQERDNETLTVSSSLEVLRFPCYLSVPIIFIN